MLNLSVDLTQVWIYGEKIYRNRADAFDVSDNIDFPIRQFVLDNHNASSNNDAINWSWSDPNWLYYQFENPINGKFSIFKVDRNLSSTPRAVVEDIQYINPDTNQPDRVRGFLLFPGSNESICFNKPLDYFPGPDTTHRVIKVNLSTGAYSTLHEYQGRNQAPLSASIGTEETRYQNIAGWNSVPTKSFLYALFYENNEVYANYDGLGARWVTDETFYIIKKIDLTGTVTEIKKVRFNFNSLRYGVDNPRSKLSVPTYNYSTDEILYGLIETPHGASPSNPGTISIIQGTTTLDSYDAVQSNATGPGLVSNVGTVWFNNRDQTLYENVRSYGPVIYSWNRDEVGIFARDPDGSNRRRVFHLPLLESLNLQGAASVPFEQMFGPGMRADYEL